MYKYFQQRFALSAKGAKDFVGGILGTTLLNISLMFPAVFVFLFLEDSMHLFSKENASMEHGFWFYVLIASGLMLIMYWIALVQYNSTYTRVYEESSVRRISIAEKLRKLPLAFFGEKNLSDLTATIMDDSLQLEHIFSHAVPQLFASIISLVLIATGLFFYNWQLSIALFWVVPVSAMVLFLAKRKMKKEHTDFYYIKRDVTEQIQEGLDTIYEMKAYNGEKAYMKKMDELLNRCEKAHINGELFLGVFLNLSYLLLKLGLATVILVGANLLIAGSIDLFSYLVFLMISASIYNPIMDVCNNLAVLLFLDVRINRMKQMEDLAVQKGELDPEIKSYDIEFENVGFAYEAGKQVLKDVTFTANQGEVTALVGPSGGGKSTAAKLAVRFWDIDTGKIKIGGKDISMIDPESLLKYFSVVFQDVVLFNASIMDNIKIGRKDATEEEVIRAAKIAQCDSFIREMPQGYHTVIGENGETLSGGERQRISIARALLKDAPIVLLDEATASLDVENETKIQSALSELIKNKTVLIIAHRMRTVCKANKIVVLENGTVKEEGDPKALLEKNSMFSEMVKRQAS